MPDTPNRGRKRSIGLAVVGAGKIGTLRARLAAGHPAVRFLAIADIDEDRAAKLAGDVGADMWTTDVAATVAHPDVDAIVVSTSEANHLEPTLAAVQTGRPTLVEKPIALRIEDADTLITAAAQHEADLRVGYSMRYGQRWAVGKEQLQQGAVGSLVGGLARMYDTQAVGLAILGRSPDATPVQDILTYLVDLICWYHPARPAEVVARGHGTVLRAAGYDIDDVVYTLLTFDDGAVFDLGVSYALPAGYPSTGSSTRVELLGTDGLLLLGEDHDDAVLYSGAGYENSYVDQRLNLAYLGSRTSGEWALDTMFGRVANETRAWLDHLTTGGPCHLTTAAEARQTLLVTTAIDEAARSRQPVDLGDADESRTT